MDEKQTGWSTGASTTWKRTPTALKPPKHTFCRILKCETRAGYSRSHACAAPPTAEQLNQREVAPIFSPMLDGGMAKQTDSSCTRKAESQRAKEGEREWKEGREEGGVPYLWSSASLDHWLIAVWGGQTCWTGQRAALGGFRCQRKKLLVIL